MVSATKTMVLSTSVLQIVAETMGLVISFSISPNPSLRHALAFGNDRTNRPGQRGARSNEVWRRRDSGN